MIVLGGLNQLIGLQSHNIIFMSVGGMMLWPPCVRAAYVLGWSLAPIEAIVVLYSN